MAETYRPTSLSEALTIRAEKHARPFAGGTDLMVRYRGYTGTGPKLEGPMLFLDAVKDLHEVDVAGGMMTIGAGATLTEILAHPELPELLRRAVADIAAPALRNRATMAGNICNASPAGDSIPPLYVHDAEFVLRAVGRERTVLAEEFFTGPGRTVLKDDEILAAIRVPILEGGKTYYRKVGTRKANALSKLSAAGWASGRSDFRFALGAVAPTVIRLRGAEAAVAAGKGINEVLAAADIDIKPIDDQRSTAAYRRQVALNALREFIELENL